MRSLIDYLKEPWPGKLPFEQTVRHIPSNPTRLNVLAALQAMEDDNNPGWIQSGPDCGPYGRTGLSSNEASIIRDAKSLMQGWVIGVDSIWMQQQVQRLFNEESERVQGAEKNRLYHMEEKPKATPEKPNAR